MPFENRITRVLQQALAEGEISSSLLERVQAAADSERQRLQTARLVAMSEEDAVRYRVISELATDWVYAARRDDTSAWRAEWATDALRSITGYGAEELNAKGGLQSIVNRTSLETWAAGDAEQLAGQPSVIEYEITTKAGERRWLRDYRRPELDASGTRVVRIFGAVKDITQQRRAEEALRDAMRHLEQRVGTEVARFRSLLDHAGESIFVVDPGSQRLLDVNATACRELGYEREELLALRVSDVLFGDAPWGRLDDAQLSEGGVSAEHSFRRKDGGQVPVELTVSLRRFIGLDYLVLVAREISERKQMQAQLAQADRMASVGMVAAGVAHEVNNPLAYIMTNLQFVISRTPAQADEVLNALREAETGALRVRDIVNALLTFSRADDHRLTPIPRSVATVLDHVIRVAHNEIRHRAQLVRQYEEAPPVADDGRLQQVFLNILINAVHAIVEGDVNHNRITVTIRHHPETDQVAVSIRDTGVGIPPERLKKIFDPFFTTKPIGVGTGLGLAICKNIVEGTGGRIEVSSTVGVGSTFTVILRCSHEGHPMAKPDSNVPQPAVQASLRVLVVDDDVFVGRSLRRLLRPQHEVALALSGRQALTLLSDNDYDIIFCDVMMPEMTGLELYALATRSNPQLAERFVFITGGPFTPEARQLFEAVNVPCLQKPFLLADLNTMLLSASERGRGRKAP